MLELFYLARKEQGRGVPKPLQTAGAFERIALAAAELRASLLAAENEMGGADAQFMSFVGAEAAEIIKDGLPALENVALVLAREAKEVATPGPRTDRNADFLDRWAWNFLASRHQERKSDGDGCPNSSVKVDANTVAFFDVVLRLAGRSVDAGGAKKAAQRAKLREEKRDSLCS
jgi:hypothetical protein